MPRHRAGQFGTFGVALDICWEGGEPSLRAVSGNLLKTPHPALDNGFYVLLGKTKQ